VRFVGRVLSGIVALTCIVIVRAPLHAQLVPTADEFVVNGYTTGAQNQGVVASDAAGNYVVVWDGTSQGGYPSDIIGRRFSNAGVALGTEFIVNSYTSSLQFGPDIAVAPDGRFVVVWSSLGQDLFNYGVFGQRFDANGEAVGTEFQINNYTFGDQQFPAVEIDAGGNFVVAWEGSYDGSYSGIAARLYDSSGMPLGNEFFVNTFTGNDQLDPEIGRSGDDFVVVWDSYAGDLSNGAVWGQRLDVSGMPLGTEFRVNTFTPGFQADPDVAGGPDGDFVVVWSSTNNRDGNGTGIIGQRFAGDGSRIGGEFVVNAYTTGDQERPMIARAPSGSFVVTWDGPGADDTLTGVWARAFSSDGTADGLDLHVNQFTPGLQNQASIANVGERDFVVVWSNSSFSDGIIEMAGRHVTKAGTPITGKKLFIRTPPSDPSGNRLTFISTDSGLSAPQAVFDDPRCPPVGSGSTTSGARLRVSGAGGAFTIDMPCVNWSANADGTRYRYRDASGTSCRSAILRTGRLLKVSCKGPQVAYVLGSAQGDITVTLSTGDIATNNKYCATFGPQSGATVHRDGSDGRSYSAVDAGPGTCL
jgi:hypothetical protein